MWSVARPVFDAEETFKLCISRVRSRELRQRLATVTQDIADAAAEYAEHAENVELHLIPRTPGVSGIVTAEEMVAVYEFRMAGKTGPGRGIYDALKLLPTRGVCPYCDHRPVSTLDHVLPKILFPALAVAPDNLVGTCRDCNSVKLSVAPTCVADTMLHPYFEDISAAQWLSARVIQGRVAAVLFHTVGVPGWPDHLNDRIRNQFRMLGLAELYGAQAAREISGQSRYLAQTFSSRGPAGVREELARQAASREADRPNCWQAVTYRVLSECDWYCDGGFLNV